MKAFAACKSFMTYLKNGSLTLGVIVMEKNGSMRSWYCVYDGVPYIVTAETTAMAKFLLKKFYDIDEPELLNVVTHSRWHAKLVQRAVIVALYEMGDEDPKLAVLARGPVENIAKAYEDKAYAVPPVEGATSIKIFACLEERIREHIHAVRTSACG
jgi:hypothetical protein